MEYSIRNPEVGTLDRNFVNSSLIELDRVMQMNSSCWLGCARGRTFEYFGNDIGVREIVDE